MKPTLLHTLFPALLLSLLLSAGCKKDKEAEDKEGKDNQAGTPSGEGGTTPSGGGVGEGMPGGGEFGGGPGGSPQQQQPTFDPNLPIGKRKVWTKATIEKSYIGKTASELIKNFGDPIRHLTQNSNIIYFYDKMYVKFNNKKYTQVTFAIRPDGKGNGNIIAIGLVPASATPFKSNGGGEDPGGFPGGGGPGGPDGL